MASLVGEKRSDRYRRFMEALQIRNERGVISPMRFSQSQEILWKTIAPRLDARQKLWFIVLKGRQIYASTFFEALTFTRTVEQPGTHSLVLAQDLDSSHALFDMAKRFYDYLPLPKLVPPKIKEIVFPFDKGASKFKVVSAGTAAKGRGTTQTCVHASECAFWPHAEILTGLFQAMPDVNDTLWVLESTANGKVGDGEMFYSEWQRAISGESELIPIFIPWYSMPKYAREDGIPEAEWDEEEKSLVDTFQLTPFQLAWRRYAIKTKCQGTVDLFHQEYPSTPEEAFISTGLPAFDRHALMRQRPNITDPLARGTFIDGKFVKDPTGEVRIWCDPEPGHQYVIGADTAEGLAGGDSSCAEVLDMRTLEQVACVHGQIPPWDFAIMLNALGRWYNNAIVAIEVNNTGHAVQDPMIRVWNYPNLHPWRGKPDRVNIGRAKLYGWETNSYSRPLIIEAGQRVVNKGLVVIHEAKLLDELYDFTKLDTGRYEAEAGKDDRVMALLIAMRSREENYFEVKSSPNVSDSTLPSGIRIVESIESRANERRSLSKFIRDGASRAVKSWLDL